MTLRTRNLVHLHVKAKQHAAAGQLQVSCRSAAAQVLDKPPGGSLSCYHSWSRRRRRAQSVIESVVCQQGSNRAPARLRVYYDIIFAFIALQSPPSDPLHPSAASTPESSDRVVQDPKRSHGYPWGAKLILQGFAQYVRNLQVLSSVDSHIAEQHPG